MMSGLVSIVLPTYTRAHMLAYAIRSVLTQTYENFELIVVDDNSKDDTPEVVRGFDDSRIRYFRNETNLKLPGALNKGFAAAGGDALESRAADFVFADYYDFARHEEGTGAPMNPRRVGLPGILRLDERNSVGACFMYTRAVYEAIGAYDPELFLVEDYDYFIRIQRAGFRIAHIPEALYYFSRHDDALFCSRFAEVQAAGILVRYKNALLDKDKAAQACVALVMRDPSVLKNPLLRNLYVALKRTSFTLTRAYERMVRAYVQYAIEIRVSRLLDRFSSRAMSFPQAKDALKELLQGVATLEYK